MKLIDRFVYKHRRFGIPNLMMHISIITSAVFILEFVLPLNITPYLYFNRELIFDLELWRLISFVFIPPGSGVLFMIITLYFYFYVGRELESLWGTAKFTLYYLFSLLCTITVGFIFGGIYSGEYINLSIFLAFAACFPETQISLFMIIAVKAKYLGYAYLGYLGIMIVQALFSLNYSYALMIIASLGAPIIFFGGDFTDGIKSFIRRQKYKRKFK